VSVSRSRGGIGGWLFEICTVGAIVALHAAGFAEWQEGVTAYEVTSIKASQSVSNAMGGTIGFLENGGMSARNITLKVLISLAYDVPDYAVLNCPSWVSEARYDVDAKPAVRVGLATGRTMLQHLLAERFNLHTRTEKSPMKGLRLVAPNGSSKLVASAITNGSFQIMSVSEMRGRGISIARLVRALAAVLQTPIDDDTGLLGSYDITLKWASDDSVSDIGVFLLPALRENVGLVLKPGKVLVDAVVVDRADRPTPN